MGTKRSTKIVAPAAHVYARISEDRSGEALGTERQMEDVHGLARVSGYRVIADYVDNDLSAFSGKRRPEFERLMDEVRAGRVDVIVAWSMDRLIRRPKDLEPFLETLAAAEVKINLVKGGLIDPSDPFQRIVIRMLGAVAAGEVEIKSARTKREIKQYAEAGKAPGGGIRAYGYTRGLTSVVVEEAARIREAAEWVLAGGSIRALALEWNRAGVPTGTGKGRWNATTIRKVLKAPRIAGLRVWHGEVVAKGTWPAIVTKRQWERIGILLTDEDRHGVRKSRNTARSYLLSGEYLRCSKCGNRLTARRNNAGRAYGCVKDNGGCGALSIQAERLEEYVADRIIGAIATEGLAKLHRSYSGGDREAAKAIEELATLEERRAKLAKLVGKGLMDEEDYARAAKEIRVNAEEASALVSTSAESRFIERLPSADPAELAEWWDAASFAERRELVALTVDSITVQPGRRGYHKDQTAERVGEWIRWRHETAAPAARKARRVA